MPKVSIIIPIYNVEQYLRECLDSVINQTLKDIEIICVNDGSKDNSLEIAQQYSQKDKRIVIISKENGGLSTARNAGIDSASGEFLYFLDSDDYIDVKAMEILYCIAKEKDLDIVYFDGKAFFENNLIKDKFISYKDYYNRFASYNRIHSGEELFVNMNKNKDYRPSVCLQFIKTSYLKDIKLRFYEGIIHEDNLFTFLCIMQAKRVSHINITLFYRRIRENSIMTNNENTNNLKGYFICYIKSLEFLNENIFKQESWEAIELHVNSLYRQVARIYKKLAETGKYITWEDLYQKILFDNSVKKNSILNSELKNYKQQYNKCRSELQSLLNHSISFRIGRIITFVPRMLYKYFVH